MARDCWGCNSPAQRSDTHITQTHDRKMLRNDNNRLGVDQNRIQRTYAIDTDWNFNITGIVDFLCFNRGE